MLCLTVFIVPFLWLISLILHRLKPGKFYQLKLRYTRLMFFDGWCSFFNETFLFLAVCSGLNLRYYFKWGSAGESFNTLCAIFFGLMLLAFTIFAALFFRTKDNIERLKDRSNEYMMQFGTFLSELNFLRRDRLVLVYNTVSMLRKIWLAAIVVYQIDNPVFSIFQFNFMSLIMMIVIGFVEPMKNRLA